MDALEFETRKLLPVIKDEFLNIGDSSKYDAPLFK